MARTVTTVRQTYIGTGALSAYTFDFKIESLDHILIIAMDDDGIEYQRVDGNDAVFLSSVTYDAVDGGGTVNLAAALPADYTLLIIMANDVPTQPKEFKNKSDFTLKRIEMALDYLAGPIMRLASRASRSVQLNETDDAGDFDPTLPAFMPTAVSLIPTTNDTGSGWAAVSEWTPTSDLTAAVAAAAAAAVSEGNAATSAVSAASSASAAATSATAAHTSELNAAGSSSSASTYATNASNSATAAASSATAASGSATSAASSASAAATSATTASSSATTATTAATNAGNSATAAALSETNAATSATAAAGSAVSAAASAASIRDANNNIATNNFIYGYTSTATSAGTLTLTVASTGEQFFTGVTTHTVVLPVASTMTLGQAFYLTNLSTGIVTVNSSGSNLVTTMSSGASVTIVCILASGTSAASWSVLAGGSVSPLTTKGDLYTYSTAGTRLGVGINGQFLVADSVQPEGIKWLTLLPVANGGTGTSTAFTSGSVVFADGSGVYVQDNTNFFWDNTNKRLGLGTASPSSPLSIAGGTQTTSLPIISMTQTWNAGGVAFTGQLMNITNTASAADSIFAAYQLGGTTLAKISLPSSTQAALQFTDGTGIKYLQANQLGFVTSTVCRAAATNSGFVVGSAQYFGFTSGTNYTTTSGTADVFLSRKAAAGLQFGDADAAAPVAQSLSFQSVVAGTSNTAGVDVTFKASQGTGTGASGKFIFQTAAAGGSGSSVNALVTAATIGTGNTALTLNSGGDDAGLTFANAGSARIRINQAGGVLVFANAGLFRGMTMTPTTDSSTSIALALTPIFNNVATTMDAFKINVTDTNSAADSRLMLIQKGGTTQLTMDKSGNFALGATAPASMLHVQGTQQGLVTSVSADTTLGAHYIVAVDDSGATKTMTLPAASSTIIGRIYRIKKQSASNSTVIARAGSDTIDGATSYTLTTQYQTVDIICLTATTWGVF